MLAMRASNAAVEEEPLALLVDDDEDDEDDGAGVDIQTQTTLDNARQIYREPNK